MAAKENVAKQRFGRVRRAAEAAGINKVPAEPKQEVIPATPSTPAVTPKTISINVPQVNLPPLHLPSNMRSWVVLLLALALWKLSTDATHGFVNDVRPDTAYAYSIAIQIGFSVIERYFFAGMKNGFTIFILLLDGFINAWGLFFDLLPRFLQSGLWTMVETAWGGDLSMGPRGMLFLAVLLGVGLAYGNDKLFSMATAGR